MATALCERRSISGIQKREKDGKPQICGYYSVFNTLSEPIFWFKERVQPGAFQRTLREKPVANLYDHQTALVLADTEIGNFSLKEDQVGLYGESDPIDTTYAQDLLKLLDAGAVKHASIGFFYVTTKWSLEDGWDVLEVYDLDLVEASVVKFPAFRATTIGLQTKSLLPPEIDEKEKLLLCRALNRVQNRSANFEPVEEDLQRLNFYRSVIDKVMPPDIRSAVNSVIAKPASHSESIAVWRGVVENQRLTLGK